jgi:hypothetical protein
MCYPFSIGYIISARTLTVEGKRACLLGEVMLAYQKFCYTHGTLFVARRTSPVDLVVKQYRTAVC